MGNIHENQRFFSQVHRESGRQTAVQLNPSHRASRSRNRNDHWLSVFGAGIAALIVGVAMLAVPSRSDAFVFGPTCPSSTNMVNRSLTVYNYGTEDIRVMVAASDCSVLASVDVPPNGSGSVTRTGLHGLQVVVLRTSDEWIVDDFIFVPAEGVKSYGPLPPTTTTPTTLATTTTTTLAPTTLAPTTVAPTTLAPTTLAPTTLAPTTLAPSTLVSTTLTPTTSVSRPTVVAAQPVISVPAPSFVSTSTTLAPSTTTPSTTTPSTTTPSTTTAASTSTTSTTIDPSNSRIGKLSPQNGIFASFQININEQTVLDDRRFCVHVYAEQNLNNVQDGIEPNLEHVIIRATPRFSGETKVAETNVDGNGCVMLLDGDYLIEVISPTTHVIYLDPDYRVAARKIPGSSVLGEVVDGPQQTLALTGSRSETQAAFAIALLLLGVGLTLTGSLGLVSRRTR
jgi:hypothetical protein